MSMICLGVIMCIDEADKDFVKSRLTKIAQLYNRNICFEIDWSEPVMHKFPLSSFTFSVEDDTTSNNCEMLLLPDGWCFNGRSNSIPITDRMMFIQEIAESILLSGFSIEFYIGTSGDLPEDYFTVAINHQDLSTFLVEQIELINTTKSFHIIVALH